MLLGIQALRWLGAVIDFGSDQALFKDINPHKVVQLGTTESGHQLLPLTADVMSGVFVRAQPFRCLLTENGTQERRRKGSVAPCPASDEKSAQMLYDRPFGIPCPSKASSLLGKAKELANQYEHVSLACLKDMTIE